MNTTVLHRVILHLAVMLVAAAALGGCVFKPYMRDARDPALSVTAPCFTGDVCAVDNAGFSWTTDVMASVRR
jgi:hypothetical protein